MTTKKKNDDDRPKFLEVANEIIHGARNEEYGHPADDLARIAAMWSAFLGVDVNELQVAAMMILLKTGRLAHNPEHQDSWIDIAGYAGCVDRVQRRWDGLE